MEKRVNSAVRTKFWKEIRVNLRVEGRTKAQVVQPLNLEARVRSQPVCVGIFGQPCGSVAGSCDNTSVSPFSIIPPFLHSS